MFLIRVDLKELKLDTLDEPTATINNSSVFLKGKRRDRVTDRYIWVTDIQKAERLLDKAAQKRKLEMSNQIASLNIMIGNIESDVEQQKLNALASLREYNNNNWE